MSFAIFINLRLFYWHGNLSQLIKLPPLAFFSLFGNTTKIDFVEFYQVSTAVFFRVLISNVQRQKTQPASVN